MQGAARTVLASSSLGFSASPIVAGAAVDFGGRERGGITKVISNSILSYQQRSVGFENCPLFTPPRLPCGRIEAMPMCWF